MDIYQMKREISKLYPGKWKDKIKHMDDYQVIAIYNSLLHRGSFDKQIKKEEPNENKHNKRKGKYVIKPNSTGLGFYAKYVFCDEFENREDIWEQMSFDDVLHNEENTKNK